LRARRSPNSNARVGLDDSRVAGPVARPNQSVTNGLFSVELDFGTAAFAGGQEPAADFDGDNVVDLDDLSFLLSRFGTSCP
jgi:hypothetical protein